MELLKDDNGKWDADFLQFGKDSGINVNCQEDAIFFIYQFSGFDEWPDLFNHIVDPEPFDHSDVDRINASHEKHMKFEKFRDYLVHCLHNSKTFAKVTGPYKRKLLFSEKFKDTKDKQSGNRREAVFDGDEDNVSNHTKRDDDEEDCRIDGERIRKNALFFSFLDLLKDEETKVRADLVTLAIIYLSRYHRNTIKATTMENEEDEDMGQSNWLIESVEGLQLLKNTEHMLNEFFQEHDKIDPMSLCFLAKCFYEQIKPDL